MKLSSAAGFLALSLTSVFETVQAGTPRQVVAPNDEHDGEILRQAVAPDNERILRGKKGSYSGSGSGSGKSSKKSKKGSSQCGREDLADEEDLFLVAYSGYLYYYERELFAQLFVDTYNEVALANCYGGFLEEFTLGEDILTVNDSSDELPIGDGISSLMRRLSSSFECYVGKSNGLVIPNRRRGLKFFEDGSETPPRDMEEELELDARFLESSPAPTAAPVSCTCLNGPAPSKSEFLAALNSAISDAGLMGTVDNISPIFQQTVTVGATNAPDIGSSSGKGKGGSKSSRRRW